MVTREQTFVRSLGFPSRRLRHDIPEAHQKTIRWMLDEPSGGEERRNTETIQESPGDDDKDDGHGDASFPAWFRKGDDKFWVSGKAGSGKSKFVAAQADIRRMLDELECGHLGIS